MSFNILQDVITNSKTIYCSIFEQYIPLDAANSDYQRVLDAIILEGADCFTDDIPTELQAAADAKQFNQQLAAYKTATARLAQYVVSVGLTEVVESQPTGEQVWDEDTMAMVDVMHDVITVTAVEAALATITRWVYDEDDPMAEPTEETIENPLITTDVAERATAQATVNATPQPVKDA
jgi:DNA-binding FrmR family transcriptional regulator